MLAVLLLPEISFADTNGYRISAAVDPAITVGSGWFNFTWTGAGQPFDSQGSITYNSPTATKLTVTDSFCPGDQFTVFDFGVPIGTTNLVSSVGSCTISDPDASLASPIYSHGTFTLAPGPHSITIQTITNPFGTGGAFLRVDQVVSTTPIPPTMLLVLTGLLGASLYLLWRRNARPGTVPL
jgi:hypothetical protein